MITQELPFQLKFVWTVYLVAFSFLKSLVALLMPLSNSLWRPMNSNELQIISSWMFHHLKYLHYSFSVRSFYFYFYLLSLSFNFVCCHILHRLWSRESTFEPINETDSKNRLQNLYKVRTIYGHFRLKKERYLRKASLKPIFLLLIKTYSQ